MVKVALFDLDGVVIEPSKEYFSSWYAREYGVSSDIMNSFFENTYRTCQLGELDMKEEISKHLQGWDWQGSVDEFLRLWFEWRNTARPKILEVVGALRSRGIQCYIASNQERYRAEYLWDRLKDDFDGAFFSYEMGVRKSQPEYWEKVLEKLENIAPQDIHYWDDSLENIDMAQQFGIQGKVFESEEQLFEYLA